MTALAVVLLGIVLGGMMLFSFVVAPAVFRFLPDDAAARFIRRLFPLYYAFAGIGSAAACLGLALRLPRDMTEFVLVFVVATGFVIARWWLMPAINAARDARLDGDDSAQQRFARLHGASMVVNLVQMLIVLGAMVSLLVLSTPR